jgi:hypothetical protein
MTNDGQENVSIFDKRRRLEMWQSFGRKKYERLIAARMLDCCYFR